MNLTYLSGYRIMWLYVMFDLPTGTKQERKEASDFRKSLLDMGFAMAQLSIYIRCCPSKEKISALARRIEGLLPGGGKVDLLMVTDRQYENIISFTGSRRQASPTKRDQLILF